MTAQATSEAVTKTAIRDAVVRLFETARQSEGGEYDPERFLAFLTEIPAPTGRRAADTFNGRRRFVRFMDAVQMEFGVCFSNDDWNRGFTMDQFVERIEMKIAKPAEAHRLAQRRLHEARVSLKDEPMKFGLFTLPLLIAAVAVQPIWSRILLGLIWIVIVGAVLIGNRRGYTYAQRLVARTAGATVEQGGPEQPATRRE
jgi:hypothetical protein